MSAPIEIRTLRAFELLCTAFHEWRRSRDSLREKERYIKLRRRANVADEEAYEIEARLLDRARLVSHFVAPKVCLEPANQVGLCVCRLSTCDVLGMSPCVYCMKLRVKR